MKGPNKIFLFVALSLFSVLLTGTEGKEGESSETASTHGTPVIKIIDEAPSATHQKELMEAIKRFWEATYEENFATTYEMHTAVYKQAVPLDKFLQKKRSKLDEYTYKSITFMGDTCARVRLKIKLKTEIGILDRIPTSQEWVWDAETSKWEVFDDPYKTSLIGKTKKLTSPCAWPSRKPNKKESSSKI